MHHICKIPVDMFKRPIVVGDILAKAVNIPRVQLVLVTVTKIRGKSVFVDNQPQPIIYPSKYIAVTELIKRESPLESPRNESGESLNADNGIA